MTIEILYLTTGQYLIGEIPKDSNSTISNPLEFSIQDELCYISSFLLFNDNKTIDINPNCIVTRYKPNEEILRNYEAAITKDSISIPKRQTNKVTFN